MFPEIDQQMLDRMNVLEKLDKIDRTDGTERLKRLRQIPPDTGKFIALLAASCPTNGEFIEIGTSAGYSTMWLSLAAKELNIKIKTFEILEEKVKLAKETFNITDINQYIELVHGDFRDHTNSINEIAFCFLDAEKEIYLDCFNLIASKIIPGGLLVADNAINHYNKIKPMMDLAMADSRFDCLTVPIGKGEFLCRRSFSK
jgi:predicted O-methyltransferase YrrM